MCCFFTTEVTENCLSKTIETLSDFFLLVFLPRNGVQIRFPEAYDSIATPISTRVYSALCFHTGSQIFSRQAQLSSNKVHVFMSGLFNPLTPKI